MSEQLKIDLLLLHSLLLFSVVHARPFSCAADKFADGCSVPSLIPAPFKMEFTHACNRHDICYGCGYHYNWTRLACDNAFYKNMFLTCSNLRLRAPRSLLQTIIKFWNDIASHKAQCQAAAKVYYEGVHLFAQAHYDHMEHDYCLSECANYHGNPKYNITFS